MTPHRLLLAAGLRYQARHRWQAALAVIGVVMGVAVVMAVDIANQAAEASFERSAEQLRGSATHRIVNPAGQVPADAYARLATTAGHPPMAPVVEARVGVDGHERRFRLVGLDIFAEAPFRGDLPAAIQGEASVADWLARPDAVLLSRAAARDLSVSAGDPLNVVFRGTPHTMQVFAVATTDAAASRDLLIVDVATAMAVAQQADRLSYIDLQLDATDAAWVRAHLPDGLRLVDIDDQLEGVVGLSAAFRLNLTAMSLLALLVGVFLIFNAVSFSIVQRRNLFGRLRALGVHSAEIARLVIAEAAVLALVGTLLGLLLGIWLGQALTSIVAATVSDLYYEVTIDAVRVSAWSLLKAALLGLGATLAAAVLPAWQAARTPALTTLSRAALERTTRRWLPRLLWSGLALAGFGLWTAFQAPGGVIAGFGGLFLLLIGAALATPYLIRVAAALLTQLPLRGVWRLAVRDLDRHLSRLGTAAAALMVALAASIGVAVMVESMRASVSDWLDALLTADLYIAAASFDDGAVLPGAVRDNAVALPGVTDFSSYRDRTIDVAGRRVLLVGARLAPASRAGFAFTSVGRVDPWQAFDAGGPLISEPLAHRLGLAAGDRLLLPTPAGERSFAIAGVFRDFASEHGRVFLADAAYRQFWADAEVDTLALFAGDAEQLRQAVERAFGADYDLVLTDARAIYDESMTVFDSTFRITDVLRWLSLGVAFVGVFSALMAVQIERRKEYAILRALGLTRTQVARLIVIESGALGLVAGLCAMPVGVVMAWVLSDAIQLRAFGWTMQFLVDPDPLLMTVTLGFVAALLAGAYPAWRSAAQQPAGQLRED